MKRLIAIILSGILLFTSTAFANNEIKVYNNGDEIQLTNKPLENNGITMLPAREICEALGHTVEWIREEKIIKITENLNSDLYSVTDSNEICIYNTLNTNKCHFDMYSTTGKYFRECFDFEISIPSKIINGVMYLPKDFFIFLVGSNIEETEDAVYLNPSVIKTDFRKYNKIYVINNDNKTEITNMDEKSALLNMLTRYAYVDSPSCGFSITYAVKFLDSSTGETVVICPALDKCNIFRVNNSNYYFEISQEDRAQFEKIVNKYGLTFPNI